MTRGLAAPVKTAVRKLFRRLGYEVHQVGRTSTAAGYEQVCPLATYAPWNQDARFLAAYRAIADRTLVDVYRCYELWTLVEQSRKLRGALLEVGVWRGGTGALIAGQARACGISEPVYLCDTFSGVVHASAADSTYRGGEHADTSSQAVREFLHSRLKLDNAQIVEGIFPDETAQRVPAQDFRFCHIDVDVYQSAENVLAWVWDKLVVGGMVVYDDYGFVMCDGVTRHVDQQRSRPDRLVIHNLNGHAIVIKIA
jgi:O-methyltransferase